MRTSIFPVSALKESNRLPLTTSTVTVLTKDVAVVARAAYLEKHEKKNVCQGKSRFLLHRCYSLS